MIKQICTERIHVDMDGRLLVQDSVKDFSFRIYVQQSWLLLVQMEMKNGTGRLQLFFINILRINQSLYAYFCELIYTVHPILNKLPMMKMHIPPGNLSDSTSENRRDSITSSLT